MDIAPQLGYILRRVGNRCLTAGSDCIDVHSHAPYLPCQRSGEANQRRPGGAVN